jgi:hypothetical protein
MVRIAVAAARAPVVPEEPIPGGDRRRGAEGAAAKIALRTSEGADQAVAEVVPVQGRTEGPMACAVVAEPSQGVPAVVAPNQGQRVVPILEVAPIPAAPAVPSPGTRALPTDSGLRPT